MQRPRINRATGKPWTDEEFKIRRRAIQKKRRSTKSYLSQYHRDIRQDRIEGGFEEEGYPLFAAGDNRFRFNLGNGARRRSFPLQED